MIEHLHKLYAKMCEEEIKKEKSKHIKKVIFNDPATIIFWNDDTKTVSKCHKTDVYSKEVGFIVAYLKHFISGSQLQKELQTFVWKND